VPLRSSSARKARGIAADVCHGTRACAALAGVRVVQVDIPDQQSAGIFRAEVLPPKSLPQGTGSRFFQVYVMSWV
jgi:hypothetical protein